jgi:hypothetical protein
MKNAFGVSKRTFLALVFGENHKQVLTPASMVELQLAAQSSRIQKMLSMNMMRSCARTIQANSADSIQACTLEPLPHT